MTFFQALFLGGVEGITEFLPVSSTAHLLIATSVFGMAGTFVSSFVIVIQCGAIAAVALLYLRFLFTRRQLLGKVLVAFLPTALAGLLLYHVVTAYLLTLPWIIPVTLIGGGVAMLFFEKKYSGRDALVAEGEGFAISYRQAFLIGCAQILAFIPGMSRSATTIIVGRTLGLSRYSIVTFSFLLALPTIGAASLYDIYKEGAHFSLHEWFMIGIGFVVAFFVALGVIRWFLHYIKSHTFLIFGWYRIIIGVLFALFLLFF